ncbi:MAG: hypothetical protein EBW73_11785, partial [Betaproteobacteria bacterium]|nr:hypothetical protein [Betaproteobacteria bacterium]
MHRGRLWRCASLTEALEQVSDTPLIELESLPSDPAQAIAMISMQLRQWAAAYYQGHRQTAPDALYDQWFARLLELEALHPALILPARPRLSHREPGGRRRLKTPTRHHGAEDAAQR